MVKTFSVQRDAFFYEKNSRRIEMRRFFTLAIVLVTAIVLAACESDESTLVVGLECNYAPFNWTTSEESGSQISGVNAYCDGYDIEIAQQLADYLGRELVVRKIDWDGLIPALTSSDIDVIIAGMSPTPTRAEVVNFSDAYFRSEQVIVVRADSAYAEASSLDDFNGARIVAQMGTLQDDLIEQIDGAVHMNPLSDYTALVSQVSSGMSDALIAELVVAQSIVRNNPNLTIISFEENGFVLDESDVTVSIAVRQSETELRDSINSFLSTLTDETRNQIMEDALNRQP